MAEEFTPEELEILDEMHAQLKQMHQILEHQHAQFMAQLECQHVNEMAHFDRLDQLLAKLLANGNIMLAVWGSLRLHIWTSGLKGIVVAVMVAQK